MYNFTKYIKYKTNTLSCLPPKLLKYKSTTYGWVLGQQNNCLQTPECLGAPAVQHRPSGQVVPLKSMLQCSEVTGDLCDLTEEHHESGINSHTEQFDLALNYFLPRV